MLTEQAYKAFVMAHSGKLFRYAFTFMKDRQDAEDILQEVLMKLWRIRLSVDEAKNPEALAFHMIKHSCLDHLRREKRSPLQVEEKLPEGPSNIHAQSALETKESYLKLVDLIQTLPDLQRDILILRNMEGYSIQKIAKITGLKINTVEVYLSRARRKLRAAYINTVENEI